MINNYEVMFIFDVQMSDDERKTLVDSISELINQNGGNVIKYTDIGPRQLAYPIKKRNNGFYGLLVFNGDSQKTIAPLKEKLKFEENIIRYLLVKQTIETVETKKKSKESDKPKDSNKTENSDKT